MRLSGTGWIGLHIGAALITLLAAGSPAASQINLANSTSGAGIAAVTYTAVLRDPQQPAQNQDPNRPNQPPPNPPAPQQPSPARKPKFSIYLVPDIGVYMPTSSKTRERFGGDWFSYGIGLSSISTPHNNGRVSPDIQFLSQSNGDDTVFFGLIGLEYRQSLLFGQRRKPVNQPPNPQPGGQPQPEAERKPSYVPYFGVSAYEAVGDLRAVEDNVHSGVRTGVAGAAFLGIEYQNQAYFEARYVQTSVLKSFDLSGFSLTIGYRFKIVGY